MNFKQNVAFDKLLRRNTMLRFPFDSSAQKFENDLKRICPLPVKLYYQYKFPNNLSPQQFEYLVQGIAFVFIKFNPRQITDTDAYYQEVAERAISDSKAIGYTSETVFQNTRARYLNEAKVSHDIVKDLTTDERVGLLRFIEKCKTSDAWAEVVALVSWLKENNPELKSVRLNTTDVQAVLDFLQGVNYGYAPEELDYFLNTDMNTRNNQIKEIYSLLESVGVRPEYIVRPDRAQKIQNAVMMARAAKQQCKELE